jgi:hypothetical protein
MDDIVEDARREVEVMLAAWQSQGTAGGMFRPQNELASGASSVYFHETDTASVEDQNLLRVVVGDLGRDIQRDAAERERERLRMNNGRDVDEESALLGVGDAMKGLRPPSPLATDFPNVGVRTRRAG